MIIGIDEVGRGAWAGPLVMAAVGLAGAVIPGLTDSKKLTKKRREAMAVDIKATTTYIGIASVPSPEIDRVGLSESLRQAAIFAVEQIPYDSIDQIVIDGTVNFLSGTRYDHLATTMKQADLLVPSVSAASIVAKVARDRWMAEQDSIYPGYSFAAHVGYGTAAHRTAIEERGVCVLHRMSFKPVMLLAGAKSGDGGLEMGNKKEKRGATISTSTSIGNRAEDTAAAYLQTKGFSIVERNWKTKWCEVDIIAKKDDRIYFVEVKYRKTSLQGGGMAAITPKKLRQMKFAAELWLNKYGQTDAAVSALEVTGDEYAVTQFLPILRL